MPAISGMNATPGKPGAPICLGNHATVYHFQRHFLEVKSCLFRPSVLYVVLRHFTVIYTTFTQISATFVMRFQQIHHFERSCRLFCLNLESGMENCHFPKVAFKNTLAFQALPIFWSRTRGNGRSQANGSGWSKMLNFHGYSEMSKYCLVFQSPKVLWNVQVLSRISKS